MAKLESYLKKKGSVVEAALEKILPSRSVEPAQLHEAMRYAVFGSGKRIRPILTLAVSEMFGGKERDAMLAACAIELIHSYSLIHDDLPCMDNADMRRGRPSCHRRFGEVIALLAGDGLLTLAFGILAKMEPGIHQKRLVHEIALAAGSLGMAGGQALDMESAGKKTTLPVLDRMNRKKTGALIKVSCVAGAICAGANAAAERRISRFGDYLGFAFQVVDDIIDQNGYAGLIGVSRAHKKAESLICHAKRQLSAFGKDARKLCFIAHAVLDRKK